MDNNNLYSGFSPSVPEADHTVIELPGTVISNGSSIPPINTIENIDHSVQVPVSSEAAPPTAPMVYSSAFSDPPAVIIEPSRDILQQTINAGQIAACKGSDDEPPMAGAGLATASFILGLCSIVMPWGSSACYICFLAAVAGVILSAIARGKGCTASFQKSGMIMSIIGLVCCSVLSLSCVVITNNINTVVEYGTEMLTESLSNVVDSDDIEEALGQSLEELVQQYIDEYLGDYLNDFDDLSFITDGY